jgi:hypothetical protein
MSFQNTQFKLADCATGLCSQPPPRTPDAAAQTWIATLVAMNKQPQWTCWPDCHAKWLITAICYTEQVSQKKKTKQLFMAGWRQNYWGYKQIFSGKTICDC